MGVECLVCKHGETQRGVTSVMLERGATILVLKNVPAQVCANCGEAYVDDATTAQLLVTAEAAVQAGVQIEVREFIAA